MVDDVVDGADLPHFATTSRSFRGWLRAQPAIDRARERSFARALAAGIPAAWALFQDAVRPVLARDLAALCADGALAQKILERAAGRLYLHRAEQDGVGVRGAELQDCLRGELLAALVGHTDEFGSEGLHPAAAAALREHASDPRPALLALLPARAATLLAEDRIGDRSAPVAPPFTARILNLPAMLVLAFIFVLVPTALWILNQPTDSDAEVARMRVVGALKGGSFDEALRALLDAEPPPGFEGLRPDWPESRKQRLARLGLLEESPAPIEIVSPRGKVDSVKPLLTWVADRGRGTLHLRLLDADNGVVVFEKEVAPDTSRVELAAELHRGGSYTLSIARDGVSGHEARARFQVLTLAESNEIEGKIRDVQALVADPAIAPFFAAHVYRASECFEAALRSFEMLREQFPHTTYADEERSLLLETIGRRHEAVQLARRIANG